MKITQLIITLLVATVTWAHPKLPYAFFAEVEGNLRPLFGAASQENGGELSVLSYGHSWPEPTEFSIKDGFAVTGDNLYLGYYSDMLGFAPNIPRMPLDFDKRMKVLNGPFQSCVLVTDLLYALYKDNSEISDTECFQVDIYFLPYDKKTGKAMKVFPKSKEYTKPLSEEEKRNQFPQDESSKPGKNEEHNSWETNKISVWEDDKNKLRAGAKYEGEKDKPKEVKKDKRKKHKKHRTKKDRKHKEKENRKLRLAKFFSTGDFKDMAKLDLSAMLLSSSVSPEYPLLFFAKFEDLLVPLSGTVFDYFSKRISVLSYGVLKEIPVGFAKERNYAVTNNKYTPGYFGLLDGMLTFGFKTPKYNLELDSTQKIMNLRFQSCSLLSTGMHVIFYGASSVPHTGCFDVDIHLLPFNSQEVNAIKH